MEKKYSAIDLFSGAGGLSLGFLQTQKYEIKAAFENNPAMQKTYRKNHPNVDVRGDVCAADYKNIQKEYGTIDIVIGGPPCQGFSNANRQKNQAISQNNMLVKQFIRAIVELQPKAFVMENVSMLKSDVHRFFLDRKDEQIVERYHIPMTLKNIVLLDKEHMFDGALEIVRSIEKIETDLWPDEQYATLNVIYKAAKNDQKMTAALTKYKRKIESFTPEINTDLEDSHIQKVSRSAFSALREYYSGTCNLDAVKKTIESAILIQRMLRRAKEIHDNDLVVDEYDTNSGLTAIVKSYAVFDYLQAILGSEPNNYSIDARVLCAADFGAPQKRMRFVVMGIKKTLNNKVHLPLGFYNEKTYRNVKDAIFDLEPIPARIDTTDDTGIPLPNITEISELGKTLRDTNILFNHIITNTSPTAMERFKALKQGQNFHSLNDELKTNTYTDISRTQNTIYLRLDYNQPSGTVVNVRKSMWVHPTLDRAVSVREAARLQTFPDSFVFYGTKDKQYQQVGNAVPPILAKAIAESLYSQLNNTGSEN